MTEQPFLREAVGITVEKFRKDKKITKRALADFSGIQDSYVRSITKGRKNPSIGVIYSLCKAMGISVLEFVEELETERKRLAACVKHSTTD